MASSKPGADAPAQQVSGTCPICTAPSDAKYRPFCSRRCADVDLSRWLRGAYTIPVEEDDDEDGGSEEPSADVPPDRNPSR